MRSRLSHRDDRIALLGLAAILLAGAVLRGLLMAAYRPGFMGWPDAKSYLDVAQGPAFSNPLRPAGYPIFLKGLSAIETDLAFIVGVNHLLGLAAAVLLFAAVRRVGGPPLLALLPAAVVALCGDVAFLEHSPLSEPLFLFLTSLGVYAATRSLDPGSLGWPLLAGLALAASAGVRVVGVAVLPVVVVWLALAAHGEWRRRVAAAGVAALAAVAVLGSYYVAEHREVGETGLSRAGAWHLYGRVAPFADCSRFEPPTGTERLCETTTRAQRPGTDAYIFNWWFSPAVRTFDYPFAATPPRTEAVGAFARTVMLNQPLDYVGEVAGDMLRHVAPESPALRGISGGPSYADLVGRPILLNPLYAREGLTSARRYHGWEGRTFAVEEPLLDGLRGYESMTRIQGPLFVLLALASLLGPLAARGRTRRAALLLSLVAWALLTAPVAGLQFSSRTAVPGFGALGAAAAVGGWACGVALRGAWAGRGARHRRRNQPSSRLSYTSR